MKKFLHIFFGLLAFIIIIIQSCKKDKADPPVDTTEVDLYNTIINTSEFTYYAGTPTITAAAGNSPHGFERVRFNGTTKAVLDSTGKLPIGSSFPNGSIIVKDVFTSDTGGHFGYAVMKKDPANINSAGGYLWAEFNVNGTVDYSITNKGAACVGCHSGSTNRDLVRTFDLH